MPELNEKKSPARPKPQPKETMTKELMIKRVSEEISLLKSQADTLQAVVTELKASVAGVGGTQADASTTTVEKIDEVLEDLSDIRPSLIRLRSTLKARIIERLK